MGNWDILLLIVCIWHLSPFLFWLHFSPILNKRKQPSDRSSSIASLYPLISGRFLLHETSQKSPPTSNQLVSLLGLAMWMFFMRMDMRISCTWTCASSAYIVKNIVLKIKFWENLLVRTSLVCARTYKLDPGLLNTVFILKTSHVVALFYGENALTILVKCPLTNFCEFSLQNQLWVAMPDTNSIWNWIHITAELFTGFKRKEKVMGSVLVGYTVFL